MKRSIVRVVVMAAAVAGVVGAATREASAFNTGGHFEATRRALENKGFSPNAIMVVRAANFYPDFMSEMPEAVMDVILPIIEGLVGLVSVFIPGGVIAGAGAMIAIEDLRNYLWDMKTRAAYFHFLNLRDPRRIAHEHEWLEKGAKKLAVAAKNQKDPVGLLVVMGIVLHAIQDMYTHSNMADIDWNRWVGRPFVLFEELPEDIWGNPFFEPTPPGNEPPRRLVGAWSTSEWISDNRHGPHKNDQGHTGDAAKRAWPRHKPGEETCATYPDGLQCGINHDSAKRNRHVNAVMMAWRASDVWVDKFQSWVNNDAFWRRAQEYANEEDAVECVEWARALSIGGHAYGWSETLNKTKGAAAFLVSGWGCKGLRAKMSEALTAMYKNDKKAPLRCDGEADAAAGRNCWVSKFGDAARRNQFVGVYSATWGSERATLTVSARQKDTAQLEADYIAGRKTWKMRGDVHGDRWDFRMCVTAHCRGAQTKGDERTGTLYFTGQGGRPKTVAGFVRNGYGIPNGFFAVASAARSR